MRCLKWTFFPARLHSTKEIIFFLENINNIIDIINNNSDNLTNLIFGDIYHPSVIKLSKDFFAKKYDWTNYDKIILEITSRKCYYYNNIPLNFFYTQKKLATLDKYTLKYVELSDDEIAIDLKFIQILTKNVFHKNCIIHIIPHLNLNTKSTNQKIAGRNELVILLHKLSGDLGFKIHDIGKYIEEINSGSSNSSIILETYMSDSTHYSHGFDLARQFLQKSIFTT